jgi:hypothetical protein
VVSLSGWVNTALDMEEAKYPCTQAGADGLIQIRAINLNE